jgi:uncharacterized protein YycO
MELKAADIVLARSETFVGRAIRFFTRQIGESPTKVNHVGIITDPRTIVEALNKTTRRSMIGAYGPPSKQAIAIYRPRNLSEVERAAIVAKAESYVGRSYGYLKIVACTLDWALNDAYVFRRLVNLDRFPYCSWLVAHAYLAAGKTFGCPAGQASPDDIWDFVNKRTDLYEQLWPLSPWSG